MLNIFELITFTNLYAGADIHRLYKEGIKMGEDVPVYEEDTSMELDEEEGEDVGAKEGEDKVYR